MSDNCALCEGKGWTCEKHPGQPWPHAKKKSECEGLGVPCTCPRGTHALAHRVVWAKLERATSRVSEVGDDINKFLSENAGDALTYDDEQRRNAIAAAQHGRVVPIRFGVSVGEILYQLRSSLDHMACILILKGGGSLTNRSQFPIERFKPTAQKDIRRYEDRIRGMSAEAAAAIDTYQPYHSAQARDRHWLAVLKALSNADKHRALAFHAVKVTPKVHLTIAAIDEETGVDFEIDSIRRHEGDHRGPFETGLEPTANARVVGVEHHLSPYVAFQDLLGRDDVSVMETLLVLQFEARQTIIKLGAFLA